MSKRITKIIAALGVVAGLGIAALPLSSYAANDVRIRVDVSATTPEPTCTGIECEFGGNNGTGYTVTITDTDGTNFNLAPSSTPDGTAAQNTGGNATAPTNIVTITGNQASITADSNTYGVKYVTAWEVGAGDFAFTTITGTDYAETQASIGSINSQRAGTFTITPTQGHAITNAVANGVYTNTITLTQVANANP